MHIFICKYSLPQLRCKQQGFYAEQGLENSHIVVVNHLVKFILRLSSLVLHICVIGCNLISSQSEE